MPPCCAVINCGAGLQPGWADGKGGGGGRGYAQRVCLWQDRDCLLMAAVQQTLLCPRMRKPATAHDSLNRRGKSRSGRLAANIGAAGISHS